MIRARMLLWLGLELPDALAIVQVKCFVRNVVIGIWHVVPLCTCAQLFHLSKLDFFCLCLCFTKMLLKELRCLFERKSVLRIFEASQQLPLLPFI
jgi:hypothetical protein